MIETISLTYRKSHASIVLFVPLSSSWLFGFGVGANKVDASKITISNFCPNCDAIPEQLESDLQEDIDDSEVMLSLSAYYQNNDITVGFQETTTLNANAGSQTFEMSAWWPIKTLDFYTYIRYQESKPHETLQTYEQALRLIQRCLTIAIDENNPALYTQCRDAASDVASQFTENDLAESHSFAIDIGTDWAINASWIIGAEIGFEQQTYKISSYVERAQDLLFEDPQNEVSTVTSSIYFRHLF